MGAVSEAYLLEVRSRAAECRRRQAACEGGREPFVCARRFASQLSVREARQIVRSFSPLLIEGVSGITDPSPWTLSWLAENLASKQAAVNVGGSQTAGVSVAGTQVITLAALEKRMRAGEVLYLYDCSIPLKLPTLTERLNVPVWFSHDWLHRTRERHAFSRSWPSLFVGAPGTRSSLHIDQWKGHFWMCQLEGCKRWTIFHPDDVWCLSPTWDEDNPRLEPSFPNLDEMDANPDDYPCLRFARRVDITLHAGQILLVPGGAPHRVVNGDGGPSVAIAGNFVDESNVQGAIADLALMAKRTAGAPPERGCSAAAWGLAELDLEEEIGMDSPPVVHGVPWAECARGAAIEWLSSMRERVEVERAASTMCAGAKEAADGEASDDDDVSYFEEPPEWE